MDVSDSITQLMDNKAAFLRLILFRQEIYGLRAQWDPEEIMTLKKRKFSQFKT